MDNRKWLAAADAAAPAVPAVPSAGFPRDTGAPTLPGAFWYHSIGEELRAVIAAGGLTPDTASLTQLRDAILALIGGTSKAIVLDAQTFSGGVANGNAVRWNAAGPYWVKAVADGTTNDLSVGFADVTNSKVYMFGLAAGLFAGLTPGARYYLDAATAGQITTVKPADAVYVGIARSATDLFADFDVIAQVSGAQGQCRLTKSGANLLLSPFGGNLLTVGGVNCTVPDAGVTLAQTGQTEFAITNRQIAANVATLTHAALAAAIPVGTVLLVRDVGGVEAYRGAKVVTASSTVSTSYAAVAANEASTADTSGRVLPVQFIYAVAAAGVITSLEASYTGHSTDTTAGNKGVEIKTGDTTRTLVGMAANVGNAWVDTDAMRLVSSWFNRLNKAGRNTFTADRSTTATGGFVEVNSEIRISALSWAGESVNVMGSGVVAHSVLDNGATTGIGMDGSLTAQSGNSAGYAYANGVVMSHAVTMARQDLTEGAHVFTVLGQVVNSGTATWGTFGTGSARFGLNLNTRG